MGLFGKLFGRGGAAEERTDAAGPATEYNGFIIRPAPRRQNSGWLLAGIISKEYPDGIKEHVFVRADTFAARDEAVTFTVSKAKQLIDERGDGLFGAG